MNLVILHYHLNRGGVTQVIFNHLKALDLHLTGERWRAAVFFGGRHDAWLDDLLGLESIDVKLCPLPHLDYDWSKALPQPESMAQEIAAKLDEIGFEPSETVIHAHNHCLGLNVSLPGALLWLAERGFGILFQVHDFAEDYRPYCFQRAVVASRAAREISNRRGYDRAGIPLGSDMPVQLDTSYCYPQSPHIHYAVINGRDHILLGQAGIAAESLHLLPNPVMEPEDRFPRDTARKRLQKVFDVPPQNRYVLYPVRCIRRKNIGEAILWSALSSKDTTFGFTLPPENAVCAAAYESWKHLARSLDLPCRFEVGREGGLRYPENIAAADLLMTTSVVEGFGMVYLESWLTDHLLAGRDLPEITTDFVKCGLVFESLQPRVTTPVDWIGHSQYRQIIQEGYGKVLRDYGVAPKTDHQLLSQRIQQRLDEGLVDFGELDEDLQSKVIEKAAGESQARTQIENLNPWIPNSLHGTSNGSSAAVSRNADIVRDHFGLGLGGRRLYEIYKRIASSERHEDASPLREPGKIIDGFLDASRYRPIAT